MKKVYVMIGNYGSGKTELALNFAIEAGEARRTELLDLDMVNTYFRLTEHGPHDPHEGNPACLPQLCLAPALRPCLFPRRWPLPLLWTGHRHF